MRCRSWATPRLLRQLAWQVQRASAPSVYDDGPPSREPLVARSLEAPASVPPRLPRRPGRARLGRRGHRHRVRRCVRGPPGVRAGIDRPLPRVPGLPRRPAGATRLAQRRAVPRARQAPALLRRLRWEPRLDAEPADGPEEEPVRGSLQPRRAYGLQAGPRDARLRAALP